MGMNIKDPQVHAMARELAARRGSSVTDAVRQALAAELKRTPDSSSASSRRARHQALTELLERCRRLPRQDASGREQIETELYDSAGLPW
jgi:antitoxin VapB